MVTHAYDTSTGEARGSEVQGHSYLHSKFDVRQWFSISRTWGCDPESRHLRALDS